MKREIVAADARTVTVNIPWGLKRRGGRKLVLAPDGSPVAPADAPRIENAIIKVLARAFRWRKLLDSVAYTSVGDLAVAEGINSSYLGRALRLTLLAPDIVEAFLDDRLPSEVGVAEIMRPWPAEWGE
jgi:hypothetical protein